MTLILNQVSYLRDICFIKLVKMKTVIKDEELEVELQELYLTGKQWLSDLEFLESEERFLREQLTGTTASGGANLLSRLDDATLIRTALAGNIEEFMNKLEPLIVNTDSVLHLALVEDFVGLQSAVHNALAVLKGIKYALIENRRAA